MEAARDGLDPAVGGTREEGGGGCGGLDGGFNVGELNNFLVYA